VLPIQKGQLEILRRRAHAREAGLPVELSRIEAGTPSDQEKLEGDLDRHSERPQVQRRI
jgi:hypothetical protein